MSAKGTSYHKLHSLTGWGHIIGLPFAIFSAMRAIGGGTQGFVEWLSSPIGVIGFLAFATAAIWYCKLEFDEVIMDYTDGGLRSLGLNLNRIVAFLTWAISVFAVLKLWLGA